MQAQASQIANNSAHSWMTFDGKKERKRFISSLSEMKTVLKTYWEIVLLHMEKLKYIDENSILIIWTRGEKTDNETVGVS